MQGLTNTKLIVPLKICYIGSLKLVCYYLQYVLAANLSTTPNLKF